LKLIIEPKSYKFIINKNNHLGRDLVLQSEPQEGEGAAFVMHEPQENDIKGKIRQ
jgi:hypothetical protein